MVSFTEPSGTMAPSTNEPQRTPPPDNTIVVSDEKNLEVAAMTPNERAALLVSLAPRRELALPELGAQSFNTTDPEVAADAKKLYLKRTTFYVTVWINYDMAEENFFRDGRLNDCGKLRLSDSATSSLNSLDPNEYELVKVRFDVGTPFRKVFAVAVTSVGNRRVDAKIVERTTTDQYLLVFGEECCNRIKRAGIIYGKRDMTLQDLEAFATAFVE